MNAAMQFRLRTLVIVAPLVVAVVSVAGAILWRTPLLRSLATGTVVMLAYFGAPLAGVLAFAYVMEQLEKFDLPRWLAALTGISLYVTIGFAVLIVWILVSFAIR